MAHSEERRHLSLVHTVTESDSQVGGVLPLHRSSRRLSRGTAAYRHNLERAAHLSQSATLVDSNCYFNDIRGIIMRQRTAKLAGSLALMTLPEPLLAKGCLSVSAEIASLYGVMTTRVDLSTLSRNARYRYDVSLVGPATEVGYRTTRVLEYAGERKGVPSWQELLSTRMEATIGEIVLGSDYVQQLYGAHYPEDNLTPILETSDEERADILGRMGLPIVEDDPLPSDSIA